MAKRRHYAVAMGDIVGSSKVPDRRKLHVRFNRRVNEANARFADALASPLTITLGDEFQGLANALDSAFAVAHFVRLSLLGDRVSTRVVVGTVALETDLNPEKAWNMMGPGLAEARERLADKKEENCYRFSMPQDETIGLLLDGVGRSLTKVEEEWTETQLEYVTAILADPEQPRSRTADKLGISDNSLYKVLRSAAYRFYSQQLETIRSALRLHDQRTRRSTRE